MNCKKSVPDSFVKNAIEVTHVLGSSKANQQRLENWCRMSSTKDLSLTDSLGRRDEELQPGEMSFKKLTREEKAAIIVHFSAYMNGTISDEQPMLSNRAPSEDEADGRRRPILRMYQSGCTTCRLACVLD